MDDHKDLLRINFYHLPDMQRGESLNNLKAREPVRTAPTYYRAGVSLWDSSKDCGRNIGKAL